MDNTAEVFFVDNYDYIRDMKEAFKIACDAKHGDIIRGENYDCNSVSVIYKHKNTIKIINLSEHNVKTMWVIPEEISSLIKRPDIFYFDLMDTYNSEFVITSVRLTESHRKFINNFLIPNFSDNEYSIQDGILYEKNLNRGKLKSFSIYRKMMTLKLIKIGSKQIDYILECYLSKLIALQLDNIAESEEETTFIETVLRNMWETKYKIIYDSINFDDLFPAINDSYTGQKPTIFLDLINNKNLTNKYEIEIVLMYIYFLSENIYDYKNNKYVNVKNLREIKKFYEARLNSSDNN